jgi:hypothetical protein
MIGGGNATVRRATFRPPVLDFGACSTRPRRAHRHHTDLHPNRRRLDVDMAAAKARDLTPPQPTERRQQDQGPVPPLDRTPAAKESPR